MHALLLHIPKGFDSESWDHNYINIMPMGLPAIAHYANGQGHHVRVMNASIFGGREEALQVIRERIRSTGARVVGMPLHWHLSGFDVCRAAELIKREFPECFVVLGGITASVFASELLGSCEAVDAVVQGDGEVPFARLLDELEKGDGAEWGRVPNLCWRKGGHVVLNGVTYTAGAAELQTLDFDPAPVMFDLAEYAMGNSMFDAIDGKPHDYFSEKLSDKLFFLNVGRGCNLRCVYCAGSNVMFARYFERHGVTVRPVDAVLKTVSDAVRSGFRCFHICFDPPFPGRDDYFITLFRRMQNEISPDLRLLFESYNLPSDGFLAAAAGFSKASIIVSPCFFDEKLMRRFKGYSFSRKEMELVLEKIARHPSLEAFVYFALLPLEDWSEAALRENVAYMRYLKSEFGCRASAMPILAEPGSPWMDSPGLYRGVPEPLGFGDFWREWQRPLNSWNPTLCRMPGVNEIFERINALMAGNDAIAGKSAFRETGAGLEA